MSAPVFASSGGETSSIGYTISVQDGGSHSYRVYQILKGDITGGKLVNVTAGASLLPERTYRML